MHIFEYLSSVDPLIGVTAFSIFMAFLFPLIYRSVIDIERAKELKRKAKDYQKRMREARKRGDEKELKDLLEKNMSLLGEQMSLTQKQLICTLAIIIVVFPILKRLYGNATFKLPFPLPFVGSDVGIIGLYIIISIPASMFFRKLLRVD